MNVLMVANLRSGIGDPGLYDFVRELGSHHVDVTLRFLYEGADLAHILRDVDSYARVVAAGGDGTVSAVAYALRDTGIPILAYPAGTANLLARNLRLPLDPTELAIALIGGRTVSIDLGELTLPGSGVRREFTAGFAIAAGAGFDATIMEAASGLKTTLGEGAYLLGALQNLNPRVSRFRLELDDRTVETDGIAVMVMNLARIQFDIAVTHGADAQDGLLEVVVVTASHAAGLLPAVWAALVDRLQPHPQRPGLEVHTASRVHIHADPPLPVEYDGDALPSMTTPMTARVLPRAGTFIVSEDHPFPCDAYGNETACP
ncbi:MAG: NAD(+)/NADH kinase [Coriobacteriia bacterium]|nr:NAD(+)/NADH kinase [Coriobacteriia bacterium]MBN2841091.1 NAD(+)/NADH kinase [Coriobacteriia bacterium]